MRVLVPYLAPRLEAFRPKDDERIAAAAAIRLPFPAPEGCVTGPCPAPGIVWECVGTTPFVKLAQIVFQCLWGAIEKEHLVECAMYTTFRAGPIVGDNHDQCIIQFANFF